jgi:hypothetical protein
VLAQRLRELGLAHVGAALDAGSLGVVVEGVRGLGGVDAAVGLPVALTRGAPAEGGLRIRGTLFVLELPVVAALLGNVLEGALICRVRGCIFIRRCMI